MKAESKYRPGNWVYILIDSNPTFLEIEQVNIEVSKSGTNVVYLFELDVIDFEVRSEDEVFSNIVDAQEHQENHRLYR